MWGGGGGGGGTPNTPTEMLVNFLYLKVTFINGYSYYLCVDGEKQREAGLLKAERGWKQRGAGLRLDQDRRLDSKQREAGLRLDQESREVGLKTEREAGLRLDPDRERLDQDRERLDSRQREAGLKTERAQGRERLDSRQREAGLKTERGWTQGRERLDSRHTDHCFIKYSCYVLKVCVCLKGGA